MKLWLGHKESETDMKWTNGNTQTIVDVQDFIATFTAFL